MRRETKSKMPLIAGILMIIAFLMAVATASSLFFLDVGSMDIEQQLQNEEGTQNIDEGLIDSIVNAIGVLILIFGIFLLIGGVFAIKRTHWGVSLMGSILGIFSIGQFFLGSILSLAALVLLFLSKDEFEGKGDERQVTGRDSQTWVEDEGR